MKRALVSLLIGAALLAGIPAQAFWQSRGSDYNMSISGGGGSYTGSGDIVSGALVWVSCTRSYSAAYAAPGTNKACRIRRASDNTETDILILTTGLSDVATATTFCASTTCFVKTAYDQTAHARDLTQLTNGNQPAFTFNCKGSLPCVTFTGATPTWLPGTIGSSTNQPYTFSLVAQSTSAAAEMWALLTYNGGGAGIIGFNFGSAGTGRLFCGSSLNPAMTNSTWHAIQGVCNGASSIFNIDNVATNGNAGSTATTSSFIGWGAAFTSGLTPFTGTSMEAGFWAVAFSAGNNTSVCQNQQAAYGTGSFGATC